MLVVICFSPYRSPQLLCSVNFDAGIVCSFFLIFVLCSSISSFTVSSFLFHCSNIMLAQ